MAYPTREGTASALFTLVSTAVGAKTSSRVLRQPADVSPAECPAIFQTQKPEQDVRQSGIIGIPNKRTMRFELWLITSDAQEPTIVPSTQLNTMVDAIEAALAGLPTTGAQTLGGVVASARIEGQVEYFEDWAGDGKSAACVPVEVILP